MNSFVASFYNKNNDVWGNSQIYKGIYFYPIKMMDYEFYELLYKIFAIPKNYVPDIRILKMSYLKYILYVVQSSINVGENEIQEGTIKLLKYCCKTDNVKILWFLDENKPELDGLFLKVLIDGIEFDESEFENIREILLEQAGIGIDFIEQFNPELEEKLALSQKDQINIDIEDQVFGLSALMNKTIEEIKQYTVFQFKKTLERLLVLKDFDIYKPLESSGQIKMQHGEEIKHFLSHFEKRGRYSSILINKNAYIDNGDIFKVAK